MFVPPLVLADCIRVISAYIKLCHFVNALQKSGRGVKQKFIKQDNWVELMHTHGASQFK